MNIIESLLSMPDDLWWAIAFIFGFFGEIIIGLISTDKYGKTEWSLVIMYSFGCFFLAALWPIALILLMGASITLAPVYLGVYVKKNAINKGKVMNKSKFDKILNEIIEK